MTQIQDQQVGTTDAAIGDCSLPPPPPPPSPEAHVTRGRALLVAGALGIVGLTVGRAVWSGARPEASATAVDPNALVLGNCANDSNFQEPTDRSGLVTDVDCADPHDFEVSEVFELDDEPGAAYPGDAAVLERADKLCQKSFVAYVGADYFTSKLEFGYYYPDEALWRKYDDRRVVCYIFDPSFERLTGSVEDSDR